MQVSKFYTGEMRSLYCRMGIEDHLSNWRRKESPISLQQVNRNLRLGDHAAYGCNPLEQVIRNDCLSEARCVAIEQGTRAGDKHSEE